MHKKWGSLALFFVVSLLNFEASLAFLVPIAAKTPVPGTPSPPGSPWPLPKSWSKSSILATLGSAQSFSYVASVANCSILDAAFERYNYALLTRSTFPSQAKNLPVLSTVYVRISGKPEENLCSEYPKLSQEPTYESYDLIVGEGLDENTAITVISSVTVWGALRGLETFSQLLWRHRDWNVNEYFINFTEISDSPRYPHRGLMVDTSRHYIPPKQLEEILDAMAYNKFNVFHWHIVDDQSFPFVSQRFPELTLGAYIPGHLIYDPPTVQGIIGEARLRGIRVVLEFDTPGHTQAFSKSHLELLTPCYGDGVNPGTPNYPKHAAYENLDPTKETTYSFMKELFTEIVQNVSRDDFVHLGMDEIYYPCWESSPKIKEFMEQHNYDNINQVQGHYTQRHLEMIKSIGGRAIIWQDPLEYGVQVEKDVIIQVWKNPERGHPHPWQYYFQNALDGGYNVLLSACWYVNYIKYGQTWRDYYNCDPENLPDPLPDWQKKLILGGEAAIWAEWVDSTNVVSRLFPFVGAVAEKLWSPKDISTTDDALWRLDEQRCRLLGRGIKAQPLVTSYCFPEEVNYEYTRPSLARFIEDDDQNEVK